MTSNRDRWTKKDYAEALDMALAEREELKERTVALAERLNAPIEDHEARAIVACAEALDVLDRVERNARNSGNTWSVNTRSYDSRYVQPGPVGRIGRVLEYLRLRYGLPDPQAELRHVIATNTEVANERDRLRRRLAEIESSVNGTPPPGGMWP